MLSLKQLKLCLQSKPMVSLQELKITLQEDVATIYDLLKYFIDRGQVQEQTSAAKCGTRCQKCPMACEKWYRWLQIDT